jgi:hypothetical protein
MKAIRVPLDAMEEERTPGYLSEAGKMVRVANRRELLVILAAQEPVAALRSRRVCASEPLRSLLQGLLQCDVRRLSLIRRYRQTVIGNSGVAACRNWWM